MYSQLSIVVSIYLDKRDPDGCMRDLLEDFCRAGGVTVFYRGKYYALVYEFQYFLGM